MLSPSRLDGEALDVVLDSANLSSDDSFDSSDNGEEDAWFSDSEDGNDDSNDDIRFEPSSSLPATPTRSRAPHSNGRQFAAHNLLARSPPARAPVPAPTPSASRAVRDIMDIPTSEVTETTFSPAVKGTRAERIAMNRAKGQEKRRRTNEWKARTKAAAQAAFTKRQEDRQEEDELHRQYVCWKAMALLTDNGIGLGEFLLFVLDPKNKSNDLASIRWKGLLRNRTFLDQILSFWVDNSETPGVVRRRVAKWMVAHVGTLAAREARHITKRGWLRIEPVDMTSEALLKFSLDAVYEKLLAHAPAAMSVMKGFATSSKQLLLSPESRTVKRGDIVLAQAATSLLRQHSRGNNLVSNQIGLYLYISGAQRQTISVISHLGLACSYPSLVGKGKVRQKMLKAPPTETATPPTTTTAPPTVTATPSIAPSAPAATAIDGVGPAPSHVAKVPAPAAGLADGAAAHRSGVGIIPVLSRTCMSEAQRVAGEEEHGMTYDNLNITFKAAEQIAGRKDSQENGTCCTMTPFHGPVGNALDQSVAEQHFREAKVLSPRDILMSPTERNLWRALNVETILWIIITYGKDFFAHFAPHLESYAPVDPQAIPVHKTPIYPIQTMHIDEASIKGNIEVIDTVHKQLKVDPELLKRRVRVFFGDQLTTSRIRSATAARTGHEAGAEGWRWAKPVQGLFHAEMTATHNVLITHWGKANAGARSPSSLSFHNTVLDRKPIVVTSLPPFRACRDLISVSLYSRILCCLLHETGEANLESCARSVRTWAQLKKLAERIYDTYASTAVVDALREARARDPDGLAGDMVFEDGVLFIRDGLALRTFGRLLKAGRSGHLILAIKVLLLSYKGGGHPKYALEMLHLLHNLLRVWPKPLRDLVLNNWLVNPTGTKDGFVSLDLMQEHLNFWIKRVYHAHGSNASWEWLATISPCIDLLRKLANHMHATLGSYQGKKHCPADLSRDIDMLMDSLLEHKVYIVEPGRRKDKDDAPVVDVMSKGLELLTNGAKSTLREYNDAFQALQRRSKVKPLLPFVTAVKEVASNGATAATASDAATGNGGSASSIAAADPLANRVDAQNAAPATAAATQDDQMALDGPDGSADSAVDAEAGNEEEQLDELDIDAEDEPELLFSYDDEGDVDLDPDSVYEIESDSEDDWDRDGDVD